MTLTHTLCAFTIATSIVALGCGSRNKPSTPTPAPDGSGSSTATCKPSALTDDFKVSTIGKPKAMHEGVCTSAQIADFVATCVMVETDGSVHEAAGCDAHFNTPPNADCFTCAFSKDSDMSWGAFVSTQDIMFANVYGCLDSFEPGCGPATAGLEDCEAFACNEACVNAPDTLLYSCFSKADSSVCATYLQATLDKCAQSKNDEQAPGNLTCRAATNEDTIAFFTRFLHAYCGSP